MKKMKNLRTLTIICLFIVALNVVSYGQTDKGTSNVKYNTWSATLSGGSMLFYGDLRQFDFYPVTIKNSKDWYKLPSGLSEYAGGFGVAISKQLSPIFGIQGMLEKGTLGGIRTTVNAHFNASILTYGINVKINFLPIFNPNLKSPKIAIYGIAGIGLCDFKTHEYSISSYTLLSSYGYGDFGGEKKTTTETVIPLGIGVKYKINNQFDIGIESTINNVNTDKLDARAVSGSAKDKYGYTALTLTYKIGKNEKSLEWVTEKDMKSDDISALFTPINKKIDSLGNKINEIDNKVTLAQKDIVDLKNPAKEADDDGDGVPNSKDLEPNTPKGSYVDVNGRAIPTAKTLTTTTVGTSDVATPLFSIFFDVNSDFIDDLNQEKVLAAAKMLKENPNLKFDLVGHADKTGGTLYNEILSKKRSQAVSDLLVKSYGIDASRLNVIGVGINEPISKDNLRLNRRVDFIIKK